MAVPPGGPPDSLPPRIIVTRPESGAVRADFKGDAVVRFDELIDEMGGAGGEGKGGGPLSGLPSRIVLSPVAGPVHVSWHRSSLHIKPREGWKQGRVYHLEILSGITDLRHNVMKQGKKVIFSTGPALPHAALSGTVLQWVEQRIVPQALIRAAHLPDTVAYMTFTDSAGAFSLRDIPAGRYRVYAIQDQNSNRQRDDREAFDSITLTVDTSRSAVFWAFAHDTLGPRLQDAAPADSVTFRMTFSSQINPYLPLDTARVRVFALPDTTAVPVRTVWTNTVFDSLQARERAIADSLKRAKDTTAHGAVKRDSAPPPRAVVGARPRPGVQEEIGAARIDTAYMRQLLRTRPVPTDRWVVRMRTVLVPGKKYLVRVRATNLNGATANGEAVLSIKKDSTRAAAPPPKPR
jgi:hypothetical protein